MRLESFQGLAASTVATSLVLACLGGSPSLGDEPGRLGRLFRMGGSGSSSAANSNSTP